MPATTTRRPATTPWPFSSAWTPRRSSRRAGPSRGTAAAGRRRRARAPARAPAASTAVSTPGRARDGVHVEPVAVAVDRPHRVLGDASSVLPATGGVVRRPQPSLQVVVPSAVRARRGRRRPAGASTGRRVARRRRPARPDARVRPRPRRPRARPGPAPTTSDVDDRPQTSRVAIDRSPPGCVTAAPGAGRHQAGALVGPAVDHHQAVEADADAAEQPARAARLARRPPRRTPAAVRARADALPVDERDRPAVEAERLGAHARHRDRGGSGRTARGRGQRRRPGRRGRRPAGRSPAPARCRRPRGRRRGADRAPAGPGRSPAGGRGSRAGSRGRHAAAGRRAGTGRARTAWRASRQRHAPTGIGSKPTRSRLAPISMVPPRVPSTTADVSSPASSEATFVDVVGGVDLVPHHPAAAAR